MPALRLADLVVRRGPVTAVAGLSLEVGTGEVAAVVGPNGAGKTSTVEACLGLVRTWTGAMEVLGERVPPGDRPAAVAAGRLGVMLQDGGLATGARPLDLLRHAARLFPRPADVDDLLARVGIDPSGRTAIRRLSGGEQQRVKCALALVGRPDLVFLDEPTAGLDSSGRRVVHDLVREQAARGCAVVLTTHLMDDVERLADRVVVVDRGRDIASGDLDTLLGTTDSISFAGPPGADLAPLRSALPEGAELSEVSPGRYRARPADDPLALGAVASWCAQNGGSTADIVVGRRPLEGVVESLLGRP